MGRNIVVGNWKMNLNRADGISLVENVLKGLCSENNIEVVFAPSFTELYEVANMCTERMNIFVKVDNKIECIHSSNIGTFNGISEETLFFNLNISNKKDLSNWLIPIKDGWCKRFLN